MTAIAEPWPVSPEKIPFENPAELHSAAKLNAVQTIAAADHHGVALTEDSIVKMVALAPPSVPSGHPDAPDARRNGQR